LGTYLALTAAQISGADAIAIGFADHYLPSGDIDKLVAALASKPVAEAIDEFCVPAPTSGLLGKQHWIDDAFAADTGLGIMERLRGHDETDAHDTANVVASKSPTSVEVTIRSLRQISAETSLEDALESEFRVSVHFLTHPDLAEGIRAQVIDKDRRPKWSPPSLTDVDPETVADFFTAVPEDLELTNGAR
jgi:enoyl-CoA hydratase